MNKHLLAEIVKARLDALEEAAQIADDYFDPAEYSYGTEIAKLIRALKTGMETHASQQPHAVDASPVVGRENSGESSGSRH